MLGFDFLLHAGLLAGLYLQPSPFLLPPVTALALIPAGYLSFLLLAVLLVWLMRRLKLAGWRAGAIFGSGSLNTHILSAAQLQTGRQSPASCHSRTVGFGFRYPLTPSMRLVDS
jgi:hypothetical protein